MKLKAKYNSTGECWAVVTGGSSGIGLAISERLAQMGYNLLIVSVDRELEEVGANLQAEYGVVVRTLLLDLSRTEAAVELHDWCGASGIEPEIVVNNAGVFIYNDLIRTSTERIESIINLHVGTVAILSRLFAADMVARGRGRILNISSFAMWMPWPGLALYSATKSFIASYTRALAAELRGTGVTATTVMPAGVTTGLYGLSPKLQHIGRRFGVLLTPERTAELALAAMFAGRTRYIPGWFARLALPIVRILPDTLVRLARRNNLRFQKSQCNSTFGRRTERQSILSRAHRPKPASRPQGGAE
jgi:short-subunit dehydrogenase